MQHVLFQADTSELFQEWDGAKGRFVTGSQLHFAKRSDKRWPVTVQCCCQGKQEYKFLYHCNQGV